MSHHLGNIGTQDVATTQVVLRRHIEPEGPTLESIAHEIKGFLSTMVRHSDKGIVPATAVARPDPTAVREDKFTALLKHIMQELQQILSGTKEMFTQHGNQPGQGPHHPPPLGPRGHGVPPVFKELQAAAAKLDSAEAQLRSAKQAENKMETELYGAPIAAESAATKKAKQAVSAAQAGVLKALLHTVDRLAGPTHEPKMEPQDEPVKEPTDIDELMKGWMQTMEQFAGVGVDAKAKIDHVDSRAVHGPNQPVKDVPPIFKELHTAVTKLESAERKLHAAQTAEDRAETKLYGAPVAAESTATTSAKKDVVAAKTGVVKALLHIVETFAEPESHQIDMMMA